ncbi:hypothetical protein F2P56_032059 [Juglans regia]|uniref:Regulator of nonsense transcripts 3B isoform X1 n=2 Tax=Juglans regia TaxID=51240 RepID=A0A2I4GJX0_JUGRE|nr:regulator of nonsense transcripts 3B isoform X1 [Juglans regia]KAF5446431.1 hypothetical protein F2P56_032059 [Juglans regia]
MSLFPFQLRLLTPPLLVLYEFSILPLIGFLFQEKREEKKHKKDKDSVKREGKKEKERSKEKHSNKKDRKEKHRDKERGCEKEKYRTLDEKSIAGQPKCYIGEKLVHNLQNVEIKDSKYVQELARRIRDEEKATESQAVQKITVAGQRKSGFPDRVVESNIAFQPEEKEKTEDEKENGRKANGQRNYVDTRSLENGIGGKCYVMDDKRNEGIVKPMEKDAEKPKKRKEKNKHRESDGKGDKPQDKDQENKSKSKDKDRAKEKKEEKVKEINEHSKQQPKLNKSGKESLNTCNAKQLEFSGMNGNSSFSEGNFGKRKELDKNGLTLDNGIRPHKLPRPVCFSHTVMENGRKLEACQTASRVTCGKQVIANNFLLDIKEHRANGLVGLQRPNALSTMTSSTLTVYENGEASAKPPFVGRQTLNACSTRPTSPRVQVYDNGEASTKPPHLDSKYLIQILSVPKMEEWSDIDGQEWLFSSTCVQSKKPEAGSPQVERTRHVWAEALQIESADVYALPYVIPF